MVEQPCIHAIPQAASQLHGVCIFCYRDRLAAAKRRVEVLERVAVAAESTAIAGRHSEPCWRAMLLTGSRCVCGHADLRAAIYAAKEAADG
jgi:hypothetical protein